MEKIPTAEDFLNKEYCNIVIDSKDTWVNVSDIKNAMIEFAKLHVEQALKEASECVSCLLPVEETVKDILNSYSLDNIK